MKNLLNFRKKLAKKELLTATEIKNVKGGRRFTTDSLYLALQKMEKLLQKGQLPRMTDLGDQYCIEW